MFCTNCGAEIIPGAKFCIKCGEPVFQGTISAVAMSQAASKVEFTASQPTSLAAEGLWQPIEPVKERIIENRANGVACCPRCGSTSLSADKKGFGIGKAVIGAALVGPIGLVAGNIGARKVWVTCLNCGHRWKI